VGPKALCWMSLVLCVACDDPANSGADEGSTSDPVIEDCRVPPMTLTPGTGDSDFLALTEGDPVTLVHGGQGGWHVEIAGEATHSLQNVSILTTITAIDQPTPTVIAGADGPAEQVLMALAAYDDAQCSGTFWGVNAFVDDFEVPDGASPLDVICALEGQRVEILTTVTEVPIGTGVEYCSITSSVVATIELDDQDRADCN